MALNQESEEAPTKGRGFFFAVRKNSRKVSYMKRCTVHIGHTPCTLHRKPFFYYTFYSASPEYPAACCRDDRSSPAATPRQDGEMNHGEARQSEDGLATP